MCDISFAVSALEGKALLLNLMPAPNVMWNKFHCEWVPAMSRNWIAICKVSPRQAIFCVLLKAAKLRGLINFKSPQQSLCKAVCLHMHAILATKHTSCSDWDFLRVGFISVSRVYFTPLAKVMNSGHSNDTNSLGSVLPTFVFSLCNESSCRGWGLEYYSFHCQHVLKLSKIQLKSHLN